MYIYQPISSRRKKKTNVLVCAIFIIYNEETAFHSWKKVFFFAS